MTILDAFRKAIGIVEGRRSSTWQSIAERRAGTYYGGHKGFFLWRSPTIDLTVGDVLVHVDLHYTQAGQYSQVFTRMRASYFLGAGPSFKVARRTIAAAMGKTFGYEDVELGDDPEFDGRCVVKTSDPVATRRVWTHVAKRRFLDELNARGRVTAANGQISMLFDGVIFHDGILEPGIELVADLASYGADWLARLRALPGAVFEPARGSWDERTIPAVRLERRGAPVWLHPVAAEVGLSASAAASSSSGLETFRFEIRDGRIDIGGVPESMNSLQSVETMAILDQATVEHDGRFVRVTPTGEVQEARVLAAVDFASALAATRESGAFR